MTNVLLNKPAPDFGLADDSGRMVKLSEQIGKPVVIFVYPQDGTQTCTAEAVSFSNLADRFRRSGIALFGLSPDSVEKHRKFKAKHGLKVALLSDPDHRFIGPWGCWAEKTMFGRKYMGVVRSTFLIGADGKVKAEWRGVRVAGHAEEVLAAARALAQGT